MRELSFSGFLKQYLPTLSDLNTFSVRKLMQASQTNPRLREPLFLYALETGKTDLMEQYAAPNSCFTTWCQSYSKNQMQNALAQEDPSVPENFHKVWRSYQSVKNRVQRDNHTKSLMRSKILRLQKEKHLTTYRMYSALQMNPGNMNAWLKHGDDGKVSLESARKVLHFAQNYTQS